jgi:hypothetical protein
MNFSQTLRHFGEILYNKSTNKVVGVREFREDGRKVGRNYLAGVKKFV